MDTSDEYQADIDAVNLISECQERAAGRSRSRSEERTKKADRKSVQNNREQLADRMIREAEESKARVYAAPGKDVVITNVEQSPFMHAVLVDERYMALGSHIDESMKKKIISHDYIDFARLLPRNKIAEEDNSNMMKLINKGGYAYYTPARETDQSQVSSFSKWEQAFRVFTSIYTREYPHRASELAQYSYTIQTASATFTWENVYRYDREFRLHMKEFPGRSWGIILQQAWSMFLKDKLRYDSSDVNRTPGNGKFRGGNGGNGKEGKDKCKRFNRGKCTYGLSCRYNHRCNFCHKFRHGYHICRKCLGQASTSSAGETSKKEDEKK